MKYFKRDLSSVSIDSDAMDYLGTGSFSIVKRYRGIVLKEYFENIPDIYRINVDVIDEISKIDNAHLMKIYDAYSRSNDKFRVDAYLAKYYGGRQINLLDANKDYVIDNIRGLDALFKEFSEHGILPADLRMRNTLVLDEGIVLIDPDMFVMSKLPKDELREKNRHIYSILLKCLFIAGLDSHRDNLLVMKEIKDYFKQFENNHDDVALTTVKKLERVHTPREYFRG